jgi:SPP1 gp7 family putative phage head morphogenesis protein
VITVAQLLVRRRVLAASQTRRRKRQVIAPAPAPPSAALLAYTGVLADLGRALDAETRATLRLPAARADGLPWVASGLGALLALLAQRLRARVLEPAVVHAVDRVARLVVTHTAEQFGRQLETVIGIDPGPQGLGLGREVRAWREAQLARIRALSDAQADTVRAVLERHGPGARVEQVAADIEAEAGTTPARAAVVARTQVLALNATLTVARHQAAGIERFKWSTVHDARVRPSHRALDGREFAYAEPPVVDGEPTLPGHSPNCRCLALPVLPAST